MDRQLTDVKIINILINNSPYGIALSKFEDVNALVDNETVVSMLYRLRYFDTKTLRTFWLQEYGPNDINLWDIDANLNLNINKLLSHPDINFSVTPNKNTLLLMALPIHIYGTLGSYLYIENGMLDKILGFHKLNPDVLFGDNSIFKLFNYGLDKAGLAEKIEIFIKHGADLELNVNSNSYASQPYMICFNSSIFDLILCHTKKFYCLQTVFSRQNDNVRIKKLFEHILQYGKLSSLQYLHNEQIPKYDEWLRNIRKINLDIETMRMCFSTPIENFELIKFNRDVDNIIRKMCIFKQNLECLTKNTITVPAYRFYDIAIIILFLMKYPQLTVLSQDILRLVAFFVFNLLIEH